MEEWELSRKNIFRLFDVLKRSANQLGLEYIAFNEILTPREKILKPDYLFFASTYASHRLYRYADNNYGAIDPIVQVASFSGITIDWGEVSGMQREFFAEAAGFGLKTGIAIPLHVPGHTYIACFADKQDAPITPALRNQLEGLSFVFLQSWVREVMPHLNFADLSPAVLRTVRYAMIGHGVKDIAERLRLRPATVERHLRRAMGVTIPYGRVSAKKTDVTLS